ncbi:hypothetical protein BV25DRAFT_1818079, partial [Artomyces pyxidatus]
MNNSGYPTDPQKLEKILAKETKADEKHLARAAKNLHSLEKQEGKAEKAETKAETAREKAIKVEHKTAKALNDAAHRHDVALTEQKKAEDDLMLKQRQQQGLVREVEHKKAELEQMEQKKHAGEIARERRLTEVRAAAAGGGAAGPGPT